MATDITKKTDIVIGGVESAMIENDLSKLSEADRLRYYKQVCHSLGLNPLTQPLGYIKLNNQLRLYAKKDCTDQLRRVNGVSVSRLEYDTSDDIFMVTAYVADREGKTDCDLGAVNVAGLKGDALANAKMKAITKAKRRATLSICGLGFLDETEIETIPGAQVQVSPPLQIETAKPITPELVNALRQSMAATNTDEQEVLKYYGKNRLEDLSEINLEHLQEQLERKYNKEIPAPV